MADKPDKKESSETKEEAENKTKTCFVIMPISDVDGYEAGHFRRVYEHIVKPACKNAGFEPVRADDINTTNHIIIDILKRIIEADMAICDLSGRNPNVLYELGIRQAFNLPVTLIKDERTSRIFDIQTLRDVPYNSSLRIDTIEEVVPNITSALKSTYENKDDSINSIIQLLGIEAAKVTKTEISEDTGLLLDAINSISKRLSRIEERSNIEPESRYPFESGIRIKTAVFYFDSGKNREEVEAALKIILNAEGENVANKAIRKNKNNYLLSVVFRSPIDWNYLQELKDFIDFKGINVQRLNYFP